MYEDEPQDRVHDVLDEAIFGDHPLGRRVIGSADVIGSIPLDEIGAYHRRRYVAPNIVVAAAGSVDHDTVAGFAERFLNPEGGKGENGYEAPTAEPHVSFMAKDTEQYHICFGGSGIDRSDDRRFALRVLNAIFGGSSSSRLFTEVREKRGLAYSVGSYTESYRDGGVVALYVGTREANVEQAVEIIGTELGRLAAERVGDDELARSKESVKGRIVLSEESTLARMSRLAGSVLFDIPIISLDDVLERIDSVTADDILELGQELYAPERFSAACVGADEDRFRNALGPVSPALT
jgi:predicted Zn-dependent peptidase